jgi:hypothetical protein
MREHRLHDRFAAVGRPGGIGADLQAGTPVGQAEAPQTQNSLQFQQVLPASLRPLGVFHENLWIDVQLVGDEGKHGHRRYLRRIQRPTRVPERAQLDREAKAVTRTALGANERQILGVENVARRHLGRVGRNAEQASALFWRQKG